MLHIFGCCVSLSFHSQFHFERMRHPGVGVADSSFMERGTLLREEGGASRGDHLGRVHG